MSKLHIHYCPKCNQTYECEDERPINASAHGGPSDSVCFHHYGVPHVNCSRDSEKPERFVVGGY